MTSPERRKGQRQRAPRHSKLCFRGHRRQAGPDGKWFCPTCKYEAKLLRLCSVDGCTTRRHKDGLCGRHYKRLKEYGDPLAGPPRRGDGTCNNGHPLTVGATGTYRTCLVCQERRAEQRRLCPCGAPRLKNRKKCNACLVAAAKARQLRATCKRFGITVDDYQAMFEVQEARCAICRKQPRETRLAVDHDHQTGKVRGLLCKRCNRDLLGAAEENADLLIRAAFYLQNPPADMVTLRKANAPAA